MNKLISIIALLMLSTGVTCAAQSTLLYEQSISKTRKVCVYQYKDGSIVHVEKSKSSYCASVKN